MSKQLKTIVNRFSQMSAPAQAAYVHGIRKRRWETKPSTQKRKKKAAAPKKRAAKKAMSKLINSLTPEQLAALVAGVEK